MSIVEMRVPTIGESITEVTLSSWLKENGEFVNLDDPICEFESDKATLEFPAEASGKLIYVASEGDDLEIGALVAKIDTSVQGEASPEPKETKEEAVAAEEPKEAATEDSYAKGHPSPAAAKVIREEGIDSGDVKGTGKDGRITKEDALAAAKNKSAEPATEQKAVESQKVHTALFSRTDRTEKLSRMRRTIASRLVSAKNNTAMLTTFNEADMSAIFKLRKTYPGKVCREVWCQTRFHVHFCESVCKSTHGNADGQCQP